MDVVARAAVAAFLAALAAFVLSIGIPFAMDDGTAAIADPNVRVAASQALDLAAIACVDSPVERIVTRKLRIEAITAVDSCPVNISQMGAGVRAVISQRTFFGVSMRTDVVRCGTVTCFQSSP